MKLLRPPTVRRRCCAELSEPLPLPERKCVHARRDTGARAHPRGLCGWRAAVQLFQRPRRPRGFRCRNGYTLAAELGLEIEFVPVPRERLAEVINAGLCDVIMGIAVTTGRASEMVFSPPYVDETLSFVVPDHRRADFSSAEWIRNASGLRIAVPNLPYLEEIVQREFPRVEIVPISVDRVADFFAGRMEHVDGLVFPAERAPTSPYSTRPFRSQCRTRWRFIFPLAYPVARATWSSRGFSASGSTCSERTAPSRRSTTTGFWGAMRGPSSRAGR